MKLRGEPASAAKTAGEPLANAGSLGGPSTTRRGFLKAATLACGGALAGGALSGCSSIDAYDADAAEAEEKVCVTYCNACMGCPLEAVVRDDNVVLTRAAEIPNATFDQKRMCARGGSIPVQLVEEKRIKYPMKRVDGTERGAGQWERISWDEAIDTICTKIKEYQQEYGPSSVCTFTYGTTEPRNLYNLYRLENVAQFSHQNRTTDMALSSSLMYNAGGYWYQGGVDMHAIECMDTFVVWGHNPCVSWPNTWRYIANAIEKRGCKLIDVDPNHNTIAQKADLHVPIRPGTDGAFALGMMNYIEANGLANDTFMKQKSDGVFLVKASDGKYLRKSDMDPSVQLGSTDDDYAVWDEDANALGWAKTTANPSLRHEQMSISGVIGTDGSTGTVQVNTCYNLMMGVASEWDLARTSEVTDVSQDTIVKFCEMITAGGNCDFFQGYGLDHYGHGYNNIAATSALRIQCGLIPSPNTPYPLNDSGFATTETDHPIVSQKLGTFMFNDLLDKGSYTFPSVTIGTGDQAVEVPGATISTPLKMLINFGGNLCNSAPDRTKTVEAYKKIDFLVVTNVEWCDTADLADIVLPAAMIQESPAPISIDGCLVAGEKCITPRWEAKPDYEIAQLIGQGIGLGEWFTEDMDTGMSHVTDNAVMNAIGITYDVMKEQKIINMGGSMPLPQYMSLTGRTMFYQETPGPFEYYGQVFDPSVSHLPTWQPPQEAWTVTAGGFERNPLADTYPLQLMAGTRRFRVHSYYGQNPLLREMEVNEPCVRMNPEDAEARGIEEGDYVKLYNDRGHAVAKAELSAGIRPGVLDIDRGWQASQYKSGCSQDLTSKQISDWSCPNYAYHDCLVQMEKWDGTVEESGSAATA
ncbi:MAG: molybdopterin-dependent oxidoreductase [Eggerthellaceae bacterium]|jgi:anaerobic selenocysteine-containing dehydrogenase|nr:molybdopterin-dependent oxidoreductase [Eggerthellaceae bacterium]